MRAWPLASGPRRDVGNSFNQATTALTKTVTAGSPAHTKGSSWTELVASTSERAAWLMMFAQNSSSSATDTSTLLDVAIGSSGNETIIIANLAVGYLTNRYSSWLFPIDIPAGTRLSVKSQSAVASGTVDVGCKLFGRAPLEGWNSGACVDTLGANTANSRGVGFALGLSSAEGTWVEVEDSTPNPYEYLLCAFQGNGDTTFQGGAVLIDIGIGDNPNEQVLVSDLSYSLSSTEALLAVPGIVLPAEVPIPAGSRLTVRGQTDGGSAQSLDVVMYGVRR